MFLYFSSIDLFFFLSFDLGFGSFVGGCGLEVPLSMIFSCTGCISFSDSPPCSVALRASAMQFSGLRVGGLSLIKVVSFYGLWHSVIITYVGVIWGDPSIAHLLSQAVRSG